jgi:ankyrin repeat protein
LAVVRELLEWGAAKDAADSSGFTALHAACLYGHLEVVRELLAHGVSTGLATIFGGTALSIARQVGGNAAIAKLLEEAALATP